MKKIIIILLTTTFFLNSFCQTWIDQEAIWHYNWGGVGTGGFIRIEYTGDTIINGKDCEKLIPIRYEFGLVFPNDTAVSLLDIDTLNSEYTYLNADTVFYFTDNEFHPLYNFGAQPGDTWDLGIDTNVFMCSSSIVHVDSIGVININTQDYRWISVSMLPNSSVGLNGKIVERFGAMESYLFPTLRNCDSTVVVDFNYYNFTCYQDNSFPLYNVTQDDCEYLLDIGIDEKDYLYHSINIYPNPTDQSLILTFENNENCDISIYNIWGQLIKKISTNSRKINIDMSSYNPGTYLIKIENNKSTIMKKIIKT